MSNEGKLWAMNWTETERVASIPFKELKKIKEKTSFKTMESRGHSDRDFSGFSKFSLKNASMIPENRAMTNSFHVLPNSVVSNHPPPFDSKQTASGNVVKQNIN